MDPTNATLPQSTQHGMRLRIARLADLSITGAVEALRIFILVSPIVLGLAQIARAEPADQGFSQEAAHSNRNERTYGPFRIVGIDVAEMDGATDESTPDALARMLAENPGVRSIRIIDCPGTENDEANFAVARMIRRAGLSTHVPADGSVRSGGVELFLAGVRRTADHGAEFGVHSWLDAQGREAADVPESDPIHADYLRYYQEIGMPAPVAREFYAFTNRTGFDQVHYLTPAEIDRFKLTN